MHKECMQVILTTTLYSPVFEFNFFVIYLGEGRSKWVKVNERRTLHAVLKEPNLVIPGIPGL